MSVVAALTCLGAVATRARLVAATSRAEVDSAVTSGEVVILDGGRGRYALPETAEALSLAHELTSVLSHRSAALHLGWAVATVPERPEVTVARNRRLTPAQVARVTVHRAELAADDVQDGVTSKERTLVDCLRTLPGGEALAIADSALRDGFSPARLRALARDLKGRNSARARLIASMATPDAANPFESVLRWLASLVPGLHVRPQVSIREPEFLGRPDLVDEDLRIVLEADSFQWHGGRADLARDTRRYNAFAVHGWLVLRFCWEDVIHHPDAVLATLVAAVLKRTDGRCESCRPS